MVIKPANLNSTVRGWLIKEQTSPIHLYRITSSLGCSWMWFKAAQSDIGPATMLTQIAVGEHGSRNSSKLLAHLNF